MYVFQAAAMSRLRFMTCITTHSTMTVQIESLADRTLDQHMLSREHAELLRSLCNDFDAEFTLWSPHGEKLGGGAGPIGDELLISVMVRAVSEGKESQLIAEHGPLVILAIPLQLPANTTLIATAPFLIEAVGRSELSDLIDHLGRPQSECVAWCRTQTIWPARALLKLAAAVQRRIASECQSHKLKHEVELVSKNLASTYEEISLLYAVTQNLKISSTDEELGRLAIEWLGECLPAKAFAVMYTTNAAQDHESYKLRDKRLFIASGDLPVDEIEFAELIDQLSLDVGGVPFVANERITAANSWKYPQLRQLIIVPLVEGRNVFGWLAAFNHLEDGEFGTVESNLMSSLGTLLGIHCGNRELYRQQSELLANIVRALVSAIDAKDPYTSGHSDRVARFAVRIALEMRCHPKLLNTIYMAGLLHDVGKIGIEDSILRKAGQLTEVEFEHIKKHPELGHKILADLKPLTDVIPAVLHHHEQWDGGGYPFGLAGEEIPQIARILAVADAFDAMTSDRPYRRGMDEDKVIAVFREGSGKNWDPEVVEAFLKSHEEIMDIARRERIRIAALNQPSG